MKIISKAVGKAKDLVLDVKDHWKVPKEGNYVPYKEFTNFVIGAGASNVASYAGGNLSFGASCLFVGAIYGLKMMDFVMLGFVGLVLNYLFAPINMILTDNLGSPPKKTMKNIHMANIAFSVVGILCFFVPQQYFESFVPGLPQVVGTKFLVQVAGSYWSIFTLRKFSPKFGKYRCHILVGIVPYFLSLMMLVFFPYNNLPYHEKFWVMSLFFSVWGMFGGCFAQVPNIQNVISPNTQERTTIMSIGSFLYSLFPSIFNIVFPVLATLAGGMTDIKTYRYVIPAFIFVMIPFTLFLVFGVKDKVVQDTEHKPKVDMKKGFKEVLHNKYLWITNIQGWAGTFAAGSINVINMLIIYSLRQDWMIGVMATILGTAWTPGMLLSPWLIKKFGKKKIMLFSKYISLVCSFLSIIGVYLNSLAIIVAFTYVSTILASVTSIASGAITADIWDYQQYISGERLDGCMGIFGYLSSPVTTIAAMLVPSVYAIYGFTSDWNILFDPILRNKIFIVTVIISTITTFVSIIPWHFYDLTEKRHEEIIAELKERADKKEKEKLQMQDAGVGEV